MKKLEQWVKDHKTCPAFKKFLEGCSSDEDYYNRIERPEYFLFGVSKRNPDLCKAVIKQALLDSVALQSDPDTTKHVKKACQISIPSETHAWFAERKRNQKLTHLQRAAHKFIQWKHEETHGQFAGGIALLIVAANKTMGVDDAKIKFMAYLKDAVSYEDWSTGLEED